ncbi:MAG TPA: Uma2 family endonuclease [Thermomicrobiales bacterium]
MVALPALDRPLTYDDLAAMPDDGKRYELINGELIELTGPTPKHQRSTLRLSTNLNQFVTTRELGEVFFAPLDVYLSPHNTVQPDIIYVSRARASIIRAQKIEGIPDLLMEVVSPSNRRHDIVVKAALYATFGVPEYWLVDPEQDSIRVQTWRDGVYVPVTSTDGIARSLVLPGFGVDPVELFAEPAWMQLAER